MLYSDNIYSSDSYNEHEIHCDYDVIVEKRAKKKKATPLQIEKQNHWNKVKKCRRTIQQNFRAGDLWCTFAYKKGTRKTMAEFIRDIQRFQNHLRVEYRKRGHEFKWIRRLEIGKRGGLHAHFIINFIGDTQIISDTWKKTVKDSGRVYFTNIDEEDGFNGLAEYICKNPEEEIQGQMSFFIPTEKKQLYSVQTSRNLKRPEPVKVKISPWQVMKVMLGLEELKPSEGFFIEQDTVRKGYNKFTHMPYIRYRERRLQPENKNQPVPDANVGENHKNMPENRKNVRIENIVHDFADKAKGFIRSIAGRWKR